MRVIFAIAWLFVGLGGVIYHFGPGTEKKELDQIDSILKKARASFEDQEYTVAIDLFDEAIARLPHEREREVMIVRLEKAKAQLLAEKLPEARQSLPGLLEEVENSSVADQGLEDEVRLTLANSQYYMTWLMRREGEPKTRWFDEIELARQNYKMLLERAEKTEDSKLISLRKEDLESAIRLARMDLSELEGLPLPSQ